jgi:hypothetical protein
MVVDPIGKGRAYAILFNFGKTCLAKALGRFSLCLRNMPY